MFAALSAYKNAAIGLVLLAVLAFAGVQTHRLNTRAMQLQVAQANATGLAAQLAAQNTGIQAVKDAGAKAAETGRKANLKAKQITASAEAKAVAIEALTAPTTCQAAIALLVQEAAK